MSAIIVPLKSHQEFIKTPGLREKDFVTVKLVLKDKENMVFLVLYLETTLGAPQLREVSSYCINVKNPFREKFCNQNMFL